jgi:hypothetical protein
MLNDLYLIRQREKGSKDVSAQDRVKEPYRHSSLLPLTHRERANDGSELGRIESSTANHKAIHIL